MQNKHNHPLTLELLRKHNRIFFDSASFHGDKSYTIVGNELRVITFHSPVVYTIDKNTYQLRYKHQ